ncbi:MAG: permease-like cell division protein FtsX, partial [Clostridia bacterium]|nr:permease-like cell division protein FtsX [Clostridia bacterium]
MKIRGFRYFMTEAFKNIFSNSWMSLASVFTVMASLLILGVFLILSINLNSIVGDLEDGYEIIVVMDETTTEEGILAMKKEILKVENVTDATLDRNSDRLEKLKEKFGENGS